MTKADLIEKVAVEAGINKAEAQRSIESVVKAITNSLMTEGSVVVTGLGTFRVKATKPRTARNPRTGEAIQVPAGKRVSFKVGQVLKNAIKR
jgi:DNA-binding protein HU-beta